MFKKLLRWMLSEPMPKIEVVTQLPKKRNSIMNASGAMSPEDRSAESVDNMFKKAIQRKAGDLRIVTKDGKSTGMDAMDSAKREVMKSAFDAASWSQPQISSTVADWFGAQSFIGYQMCAVLQQQWLIGKACRMPAEDAVRKGWNLTRNDGSELTPEQTTFIRDKDTELKVDANLVEYVEFARVFGIRVLMFLVNDDDPKYYEKPFNPDGVKAGSYRGITQVDPYWMAPELDMSASADPVNKDFYVPTYWRIGGGLRVHRSHLCVYIPFPVADVLKPTYFFGGVPLTQRIYERVYNAERCATEAPELLVTKRLLVLFGDVEAAVADPGKVTNNLSILSQYRNNFGVSYFGADDRVEQKDTSLADLDATILTQYELVAAIAGVPSPKLLGKAPAGSLGATGEYEEGSYHESLESIQTSALDEVLSRHYLLMARSWPTETGGGIIDPAWNELDALTEAESTDINLKKSQTATNYANIGATDGETERARLVADPTSGYHGMTIADIDTESMEDDEELDDTDGDSPDEQA